MSSASGRRRGVGGCLAGTGRWGRHRGDAVKSEEGDETHDLLLNIEMQHLQHMSEGIETFKTCI
jgi:hypothetical protein